MKKVILIIAILLAMCQVSEAKRFNKYFHRKHQNRVFQRYIQTPMPGKGKLSQTFAPKGDHFRFLNKYY